MLLFLLLSLISIVLAEPDAVVQLEFVNTVIPRGDNIFAVCEGLNLLYEGNVTACFDQNQTQNMRTHGLRLLIQSATITGKKTVVVDPIGNLEYMNTYLFNRSFFDFPEEAKATNIYVPVDLKLDAFLASSLGVTAVALVITMLVGELPCRCCKKNTTFPISPE